MTTLTFQKKNTTTPLSGTEHQILGPSVKHLFKKKRSVAAFFRVHMAIPMIAFPSC